ncbi:hypothetical protein HYC85_009951 [Camellia sinensis]|uniref:Phytocyanin domain-containing protein n=1 Tax=Camellia sinensis TaxID=4442 RepID=A0A7J7HHX4_CAMSI|nr:hypothetical protein HYC85_009951 [Camellia sinensis]
MSHQGRGNAIIAAVGLVVCMVVLLRCEVAQGSNFTVGDAGGWTFSVSGWPNGKSFKAGDILGIGEVSGTHPPASSRLCFQVIKRQRTEERRLDQQDYTRKFISSRTIGAVCGNYRQNKTS